ncbi:MAG: hypothetical protein E6G49_03360 [Actinobacteria bacterium]|nr:MAG: hypothetical protein E6G49_03360 [Actinomycetota bacterium]
MPWKPSYTKEDAAEALSAAESWADALRRLGVSPYGKNFSTIRKWAARWEIDTTHLPPHRPRRAGPRFTELQAREAITRSRSWTEALRRLGYCPTGGNPQTLKAWAHRWKISADHFDPWAANREALRRANQPIPLDEILVEGSTYSRSNLKPRLYQAGLKRPICEICGQGEIWRGRRMGLILDHVNGTRNDNRIENIRIICPNCAATLDTHCGRKARTIPPVRNCALCGGEFPPRYSGHRYCSRACGSRWKRQGVPQPGGRKVERPPYAKLLEEIDREGYLATARRCGVSDNAIRKWVRQYERERALNEGRDPANVKIRTRTWPNRRRHQSDISAGGEELANAA